MALSMFQPVAVQIAPGTFRPLYPFVAVITPDGETALDGWLQCRPVDAFCRWIKDTNVPELPSRRTPFVWVEGIRPGDGIGHYSLDRRCGDVPPIPTTLREASRA